MMSGMRIGIIGAGITGVSIGAHYTNRGHTVTIFDKQSCAGGVWINQSNSTSRLQIHSYVYTFYNGVRYGSLFPSRSDIVDQLNRVIVKNKLEHCIRYCTAVTKAEPVFDVHNSDEPIAWKVYTDRGESFEFDILFVATGLHGKLRDLPEKVVSDAKARRIQVVNCCGEHGLDSVDFNTKRVIVIGSGAFGVEAMRTAKEKGASAVKLLGRNPTWVYPHATLVTCLMFLGIFRYFIAPIVTYLTAMYYKLKGFGHFTPSHNVFDDVVTISREFFEQNPSDVVRVDTHDTYPRFPMDNTVCIVEKHSQVEQMLEADIIVNATGFEPIDFSFLPELYRPRPTMNSILYMYQWHPEAGRRLCFSNYLTGIGTNGMPVPLGSLPELTIRYPSLFPNKKKIQAWIENEMRYTSLRFQVTTVGYGWWKIITFLSTHPIAFIAYMSNSRFRATCP